MTATILQFRPRVRSGTVADLIERAKAIDYDKFERMAEQLARQLAVYRAKTPTDKFFAEFWPGTLPL